MKFVCSENTKAAKTSDHGHTGYVFLLPVCDRVEKKNNVRVTTAQNSAQLSLSEKMKHMTRD
jgi:hypothetical protein